MHSEHQRNEEEREKGKRRERQCGSYPSIQGQQDGVTFDVTVNDALRVEISQCLQDCLTHCSNLLLTQPVQLNTANHSSNLSTDPFYVLFWTLRLTRINKKTD